jgi:hypothetical protein
MAIIQEKTASSETKYPAILTVPAGEMTGRQLGMAFDICDSPVCECTAVRVALMDELDQPVTQFSVDVSDRARAEHSERLFGTAHALSETEIRSFDDADWSFLWKVFGTVKAHATDTLDPRKVEVDFPMSEDIEAHGELVSYNAVLPHAEKFFIEYPDEAVLLDEQYCLARGCECDRVAVAFICLEGESRNRKQKKGDSPMVWVSYRTGKVTDIEAGDATTREAVALLDGFKAKFPHLLDTFSKRHKQLSLLYDHYWQRRQASLRAKSTKVGRNELCPCGSGKKYKKCCGG